MIVEPNSIKLRSFCHVTNLEVVFGIVRVSRKEVTREEPVELSITTLQHFEYLIDTPVIQCQ